MSKMSWSETSCPTSQGPKHPGPKRLGPKSPGAKSLPEPSPHDCETSFMIVTIPEGSLFCYYLLNLIYGSLNGLN